jgi:hypothetical protein
MNQAVECFKCWRSRWTATGRFESGRRGLRRAELICTDCGYRFFSARPVALEAAKAKAAEISTGVDNRVENQNATLGHSSELPNFVGPEPPTEHASDFKLRQAGDTD